MQRKLARKKERKVNFPVSRKNHESKKFLTNARGTCACVNAVEITNR
jgi:hypothetical protein